MRHSTVFTAVLTGALLVTAAAGARAQSPEALTPEQAKLACAIPAALELPRVGGYRIAGGQHVDPRGLLGPRDLIVLDGGSQAGLQLGQQFFARRSVTLGASWPRRPRGVYTSGVIRVVALSDTAAIASVDLACGDILPGDYIDPFVVPAVPDGMDRADVSGEPDFGSLGRVVFGADEMRTGATGDFMIIDQGSQDGLAPGARLAIYRDLRKPGLPLASIGEAIVVSTSPATSVMRINAARDAIASGDFVARRK